MRTACLYTAVVVTLASGIPLTLAETQPAIDFASLIRTPAGIQQALELCDGHPEFETALSNWLETAEPTSPADRKAVRETALRLLGDTTDLQLALGLSDGLLRHDLEDVKRDQTIVPQQLARSLYAGIRRAIGTEKSKAKAVAVTAYGLVVDGTVTDERQAIFLEDFLKLADPGVAHLVRSSPRPPGESARASREQSDRDRRSILRP
jgi:hypothetical protein